jgi:hypothetical protein
MKAFLLSVAVAIVLGAAAAAILDATQQRAYEAYATSAARVSDPGHNLVGREWSGEPSGRGS